jgi:hypothetical protein
MNFKVKKKHSVLQGNDGNLIHEYQNFDENIMHRTIGKG